MQFESDSKIFFLLFPTSVSLQAKKFSRKKIVSAGLRMKQSLMEKVISWPHLHKLLRERKRMNALLGKHKALPRK